MATTMMYDREREREREREKKENGREYGRQKKRNQKNRKNREKFQEQKRALVVVFRLFSSVRLPVCAHLWCNIKCPLPTLLLFCAARFGYSFLSPFFITAAENWKSQNRTETQKSISLWVCSTFPRLWRFAVSGKQKSHFLDRQSSIDWDGQKNASSDETSAERELRELPTVPRKTKSQLAK